MQPTILRNLGEKLGQVLEVEAEGRGIYSSKFVRLRILKMIDDPLEKDILEVLKTQKRKLVF